MVERQQVPGKLIQTLTCRRHAVISLAKIIPPVDPTCAKVRALTVLAQIVRLEDVTYERHVMSTQQVWWGRKQRLLFLLE